MDHKEREGKAMVGTALWKKRLHWRVDSDNKAAAAWRSAEAKYSRCKNRRSSVKKMSSILKDVSLVQIHFLLHSILFVQCARHFKSFNDLCFVQTQIHGAKNERSFNDSLLNSQKKKRNAALLRAFSSPSFQIKSEVAFFSGRFLGQYFSACSRFALLHCAEVLRCFIVANS